MDTSASLDIILPCYNPSENWTQCVVDSFIRIKQSLSETKVSLIIVNDGSSRGIDETSADYLKSKIPGLRIEKNLLNEGKGSALRKGVSISESDFQIYTDIDFPYREQNVIEIYNLLKSGSCDVVIGVRDEMYYKSIPAVRILFSKLLKSVVKLFFKIPTADTQAGLKGFNGKGKGVFLQTKINRYLFDLEFIYLASQKKDVKIVCSPVTLKEGIIFSRMNWKVLVYEAFNFLRIFFMRRD